jgi:hypothetical protein
MRGRNNNGGGGGNNNNNNRKGPNPLTRNYESNGPDVKIRGSAQQIAEKYATLARDAQSSGDRVMAENYLQHAEHYNRIIAAAQAQMPIQNVQNNRDDFDDDGDEEHDDFENGGNGGGNGNNTDAPVSQANNGSGPQPVIEGTPAEVALNTEGRENGGNREGNGREGNGRQRERRPNGGYGQNGQQRGDYQPRGDQNGERGERVKRAEAPVTSETQPSDAPAPSEPVAAQAVQSENLSPADLAARAELNEAANETAAPRRPRRPRRPRVSADSTGEASAEAGTSEPAASES